MTEPCLLANWKQDELMEKAKPFDIPKRFVWEAWQLVLANEGAAGIDGQTLERYEANLAKNLYKLWNRMSSGSYYPKPVRRVDIPKKSGGTRPLGIPTVAGTFDDFFVHPRSIFLGMLRLR